MDNDFERYIENTRTSSEQGGPSQEVWQKLQAQLREHHAQKQHSKTKLMRRWIAAAVLVLLAGTIVWVLLPHGDDNKSLAKKSLPGVVPENVVSNSYDSSMHYYQAAIAEKQNELDGLLKNDPALQQDFKHALDNMQDIIKRLQLALPQSLDKEKILQSIIKNLQMQETILSSQLEILKNLQNTGTNENTHTNM